MKPFNRFIICCFTPVLATTIAYGHGDTERPLYVAEDGSDGGSCLEADNPCATIGYALSRAGKGGEIRVAAGSYDIENAEDVFHLISGVVDLAGGYLPNEKTGNERSRVSTLRGVPHQYRELLQGRGFKVIADQKGIENARAAKADRLIGIHRRLKSSIAATPCVGGVAAGLPCENVDLLSHVGFVDVSSTPSAGNDIWGFVDLNTNREYAIVGFNLGTAVFDVTDAENPREVGFIDGQSASWRDIKVLQFFDTNDDRYKAYAYVTTDGSTDGLFVIDLTSLPHSISRVSYPSDITSAHNVYAANTDYSTGLSLTGDTPSLVIAGSSVGNGRYRSYSLSDPESPLFVSGGTGVGYMHDASSIIITDARKDTQCVNGGAHCEVLLDFNENTFELWDVTDAATPTQLSNTPYANAGYVHSGWWSEDKQFVYVHDELDEQNFGLATTVRIFSLADLTTPVLAGTWTGPTNAIDHNGFVRGNRYYMSNYSRGLTVLDITDQANPVAVGRIDTYPATDGTMFVGSWGAYPFLWSGNIAISDIDSGFYMAADQTRDVVEGKLEFSAQFAAADEGQQAQLVVQRGGGSTGAISVDYETVNASTDIADYTVSGATLTWADGDTTTRNIDISAVNDGVAENMEQLVVRLINPGGGATLGNSSTASVYVSDSGAASTVSFTASGASVPERGFGTIIAVLRRSGSAVGAASVDIGSVASATPGVDFNGTIPGVVSWADGDAQPKTIVLSLVDDGVVEANEAVGISIANPVGVTLGAITNFNATIVDGGGVNTPPNAIAGISQTVASGASVTLDGTQSNDPNGDTLSFLWTQTSGQSVTLTNASTATASFGAPSVTSDTMLQFQLTVMDPNGLSDSAPTTVTVTGTTAVVPQPSGGGGGGAFGLLSTLLLGIGVLRRQRIEVARVRVTL